MELFLMVLFEERWRWLRVMLQKPRFYFLEKRVF
jgi:hypothetical protein